MKIKKAILTGGGRATRLRPITTTINKHLIPLANKPMIFHAIDKAVEAGIEEIFINTNPGDTQLRENVGDGGHWGIKIKFFEQTGGPQGIAHLVKRAEEFIGREAFMLYLSDNILLGSVKPLFEYFEAGKLDCLLSFSRVENPSQFGVPVFSADGRLADIIEKPADPPNNFAQTGIYLYGPKVFFEAFKHSRPSPRGEYEITDIHSYFLRNNYKVGYREITGWWKDTGRPEDLIAANHLLLEQMPAEAFAAPALDLAANAVGKVQLGIGAALGAGVRLIGPVMIGENCTLENCTVGPYATVGAGTVIKNATVTESIVFGNCRLEAPIKISHSIIGDQAVVIKSQFEHHRLILGDYTVIEV